MVIGVDVDGVLADFITPYINLLNNLSAVKLPPASADFPTCWDFAGAAGVPAADVTLAWAYITAGHFFANLPPLKYAHVALARLHQLEWDGAHVYFITARPGKWAKTFTEDWLDVHGFRRPTVIIAEDKGPLARALHLDVFIDDRPENCVNVAAYCSGCRVFMPDQPYNRDYNPEALAHYGIQRVADVRAALEGLDGSERLDNREAA